MRICVIVPTTEGPATILRLSRLLQAPRSVMRTQDDYRPLPPSARYHAFVQPGGPLANSIGSGDGQYELRLGAAVETGRSWELPVAIAHWLQGQGHDLGADAPDLLIWATGALDNDLNVLPQDYHVDRKLDQSMACLQAALDGGARVILFLPVAVPLPAELQRPEIELHVVAEISSAIAVLDGSQKLSNLEDLSPAGRANRSRIVGYAILVVAVLIVLVWLVPIPIRIGDFSSLDGVAPGLVERVAPELGTGDTRDGAVNRMPSEFASQIESGGPGIVASDEDFSPAVLALPRLVLEYAPDGSSCQAVLFGSLTPDQRDLRAVEGAYPAIRLTGLCTIGFSLPAATSSVVQVTLPSALLALVLPSDRRESLQLQPGEIVMLRLRAKLPEALEAEIGLSSEGEQRITFSLVANR